MEKLKNIFFDNDDKELFLVDDLQLKADAIRNSILPKMQVVVNYAISQIEMTYNVNVFDDCMIAQAPHHRLTRRKGTVKKNFDFARVSIRGQRNYEKWKGIETPDGADLQVSPFSLNLRLTIDGLFISLTNHNQRLSKKSNKKVFDFLSKYSSSIDLIQKSARVFYHRICKENDWLASNETWLKEKFRKNDFEVSMFSDEIPYPIEYEQLKMVVSRLTLLYPLFRSYIQIGKGQKIKFADVIVKFNGEILHKQNDNSEVNESLIDLSFVKERAAAKIKVMPGIRWQVFQRDNWRCLSCGRKVADDDTLILHVDHILPRSKGGKDEFENYQTLCDKCNIGKSNKDDRSFREKAV